MKRLIALGMFTSALAVAAPALKLSANKNFENFGSVVETKGVACEMPRPGELRVSVSKEAASERKVHERARPNVARTVGGDVELTVRITHTPPDLKDLAAVEKGETIAAAGIAIYKSDGNRGSLVILNRLSRGGDDWHSYFKLSAIYETNDTRESPAISVRTTPSRISRSTSA